MTNKDFIVAGIKNLLKRNYRMETDLYNIQDKVDATLSFQENWELVKEELNIVHYTKCCPHCGEELE